MIKDNNSSFDDFDKLLDLRDSYRNEIAEDSREFLDSGKDTNLESKDTFGIGNLNSNNYNIENINIKKNSEIYKDNFNFDNLSNKENYFEIEYKNNSNINNQINNEGLSNNNLLNKFYELKIEDYPDRNHLNAENNSYYDENKKSKKTGLFNSLIKPKQ